MHKLTRVNFRAFLIHLGGISLLAFATNLFAITEVKIGASDIAAEDYFGIAVSVSADTAVVGSYRDQSTTGSAYVYYRNEGGANNWGERIKITASDAGAGDSFGFALSLDGDTLVVSARDEDDVAQDSGAAYVFYRNQGGADNWGEVTKLKAINASSADRFGYSVSVQGDTVVIGAIGDDDINLNSGAAFVFSRNEGGADNWGQVAKLKASDATNADQYGISVSVYDDTVVVGASEHEDNAFHTGAAYVYLRDQGGIDNWGELKKLNDTVPELGSEFGISVSAGVATIVVGAWLDDDPVPDSGSAYVFSRGLGGPNNWGLVTKLTASDAATDDNFGVSVFANDDRIVVGANHDSDAEIEQGAAYVFARNLGGNDNWGEVLKITASDAAEDDWFGSSVAVDNTTVISGAYLEDDNNLVNAGSAYIFNDTPLPVELEHFSID